MPAFESSGESLSFKTRVLSVDGGTLSSSLERHYFFASVVMGKCYNCLCEMEVSNCYCHFFSNQRLHKIRIQ